MEAFARLLQDTLVSIQQAEESRSKDSAFEGEGQSWKADEFLKVHLSTIMQAVNALSDSCTKLTVFVSANPKEAELQSLIDEMKSYVQAIICEYIMLSQSSMGRSCFKAMSAAIRRMIQHVHDLVVILHSGNDEASKSAVGLVWKTAKEVSELPMSNKAACRRCCMQEINMVKDTVREFAEYLVEAMVQDESDEEPAVGANNENEDDDDDDNVFDDEDQKYTPEEIPVVSDALDAMKQAQVLLKLSLQIMTEVADKVEDDCSRQNTTHVFNRVSASAASRDVTEAGEDDNDGEGGSAIASLRNELGAIDMQDILGTNPSSSFVNLQEIMVWVKDITNGCISISNSVMNYGCELYPPLTAEDVASKKESLKQHLNFLLNLLSQEPFQSYCSELFRLQLEHCANIIARM